MTLRSDWVEVQLQDLRAVGDGTLVGGPFGSELTQTDYVPEPGVPVIRGTNLGGKESRFVDDDFVFVTREKANKLRRNLAFPGDVIFTQRGTLGQIAIIPEDARFPEYVISQSQMKLTPDLSKIAARFLYQYFRTPTALQRLLAQTQATGVPHINLGILKRFRVPLPPLEEQRRIADILDRAEALRAKRRAALAHLDTLTQSIFLDLFGDPNGFDVAAVGELIRLKSGEFLPSEAMNRAGPFPVFGGNGINGYHDQYLFEESKIVIGRVGAYCGCVHQSPSKAWVTDNALYVSEQSERVQTAYLVHALTHANLNQYASQSGQPLISGSRIYPVRILVPPEALQRDFAERITALEKLKAAQRRSLAELDALFASLQHRAFRGEL